MARISLENRAPLKHVTPSHSTPSPSSPQPPHERHGPRRRSEQNCLFCKRDARGGQIHQSAEGRTRAFRGTTGTSESTHPHTRRADPKPPFVGALVGGEPTSPHQAKHSTLSNFLWPNHSSTETPIRLPSSLGRASTLCNTTSSAAGKKFSGHIDNKSFRIIYLSQGICTR